MPHFIYSYTGDGNLSFSILGLPWRVLQWIFLNNVFTFSGIYSIDAHFNSGFNSLGGCKLGFQRGFSIVQPQNSHWGFNFYFCIPSYTCPCLPFDVAMLLDVKFSLTVALMYISLMVSDCLHIFFGKMFIRSLVWFLIGLFIYY